MEKRLFKICEAVALGIDHYYMKKWRKVMLTPKDRAEALLVIPTLPAGWMREEQEWNVFRRNKNGI